MHGGDPVVLAYEHALSQISTFANAQLRACSLNFVSAVASCETASQEPPFPETLAACVSEKIVKKRAAVLFQTYAAAKGAEDLYATFKRVQDIRDVVGAMRRHPLLEEVTQDLSGEEGAALGKASKLEVLVLTLLSMVALWRSLKPVETRSGVATAALNTLPGPGSSQGASEGDTEEGKVPEPLVSLLKQVAQGGKLCVRVGLQVAPVRAWGLQCNGCRDGMGIGGDSSRGARQLWLGAF